MFNGTTCKVRRKAVLCLMYHLQGRKEGCVMFNDTTYKVGRKDVLCLTARCGRKEGYVMFNDTTWKEGRICYV